MKVLPEHLYFHYVLLRFYSCVILRCISQANKLTFNDILSLRSFERRLKISKIAFIDFVTTELHSLK